MPISLLTGVLDDAVVYFDDGERVELTQIEWALVQFLAAREGTLQPREILLREVWGSRSSRTRALDTTASRLRAKLRPENVPQLVTERGRGLAWFPPWRSRTSGELHPVLQELLSVARAWPSVGGWAPELVGMLCGADQRAVRAAELQGRRLGLLAVSPPFGMVPRPGLGGSGELDIEPADPERALSLMESWARALTVDGSTLLGLARYDIAPALIEVARHTVDEDLCVRALLAASWGSCHLLRAPFEEVVAARCPELQGALRELQSFPPDLERLRVAIPSTGPSRAILAEHLADEQAKTVFWQRGGRAGREVYADLRGRTWSGRRGFCLASLHMGDLPAAYVEARHLLAQPQPANRIVGASTLLHTVDHHEALAAILDAPDVVAGRTEFLALAHALAADAAARSALEALILQVETRPYPPLPRASRWALIAVCAGLSGEREIAAAYLGRCRTTQAPSVQDAARQAWARALIEPGPVSERALLDVHARAAGWGVGLTAWATLPAAGRSALRLRSWLHEAGLRPAALALHRYRDALVTEAPVRC